MSCMSWDCSGRDPECRGSNHRLHMGVLQAEAVCSLRAGCGGQWHSDSWGPGRPRRPVGVGATGTGRVRLRGVNHVKRGVGAPWVCCTQRHKRLTRWKSMVSPLSRLGVRGRGVGRQAPPEAGVPRGRRPPAFLASSGFRWLRGPLACGSIAPISACISAWPLWRREAFSSPRLCLPFSPSKDTGHSASESPP